jgi:hypothetical protein
VIIKTNSEKSVVNYFLIRIAFSPGI